MITIPFLAPGKQWPPQNESARLTAYSVNERYYRRQARELITARTTAQKEVMLRLANLVSKAYAALLFGEPLSVGFKGESDGARANAAAAWDIIADRSEWDALNFEQAFIASCMGDAFYKVTERDKKVRIGMVPGSIVFVHTSPDDVREVLAYVIAWMVQEPGAADKWLLKAEIHEPGLIRHELYRMDGKTTIKDRVKFSEVYGAETPSEITDEPISTGIDDFLVQHVPNNRWGSVVYGEADIAGQETILRAIEDRALNNKLILDDHARPKMAVPPGILDEQGKVRRESFDGMLFEMMPIPGASSGGLLVPQYITWNGEMTSAQAERDWLRDTFLMMTQIAPQLLNLTKDGNAPSGSALRRMMLGTVAATNQKRIVFSAPIRKTIRNAMALAGFKDIAPTVEWQDGLPMDPLESAQVEQIRTGGKPTTSLLQAIKRIDGGDDAAAAETMRQIEEDRASEPADPRDLAGNFQDALNV